MCTLKKVHKHPMMCINDAFVCSIIWMKHCMIITKWNAHIPVCTVHSTDVYNKDIHSYQAAIIIHTVHTTYSYKLNTKSIHSSIQDIV